MCFQFHHLKVDYKNGDKWELMRADFQKLKELFETWQTGMEKGNGWNALFWCNHDQPRIVSRMGDEKEYWEESAKMLATCIHLLRGTPYIFQGEEIGMLNPGYGSIEEYRDVESINYYQILLGQGKTEKEALEVLRQRSRDNGRSPMQWDSGEHAGFSRGKPWIGIPGNYQYINVEAQEQDKGSILNYYRELVKIRKDYAVVQEGGIQFLYQGQAEVFAYKRSLGKQELFVLNNLSGKNTTLQEAMPCRGYQRLIGNYSQDRAESALTVLRPYESIALFRD